MKFVTDPSLGVVGVELSERNVLALVSKLRGPRSARAIMRIAVVRDTPVLFTVSAAPDDEHYEAQGRPAGRMSFETEAQITKPSTGLRNDFTDTREDLIR